MPLPLRICCTLFLLPWFCVGGIFLGRVNIAVKLNGSMLNDFIFHRHPSNKSCLKKEGFEGFCGWGQVVI